MKRLIALFCIVALFLAGCSSKTPDSSKLQIVTTIFPPSSFAKEIAGDKAEVTKLLKDGTESHGFEPSPADIQKITNCDVFIYNGAESDAWVDKILSTVDMSDMQVVKMVDSVSLVSANDEHIWTSPKNAISITKGIANAIIKADNKNKDFYKTNLNSYLEKLNKLDKDFENIVASAKTKEIIFGDRFPFTYFVKDYGLTYHSAFAGCSHESEPSAKVVADLIEVVKKDKIPVVFYLEMSKDNIAKTIAEESGAKTLMLHSCHNISPDEKSESYLSLMNKNADNLKIALGVK